LFLGLEWIQKSKIHTMEILTLPRSIKWGIYFVLYFSIVTFGEYNYQEFIYFQF